MGFGNRLTQAIRQSRTPAVVGIDPRADLLPSAFDLAAGTHANLANAYRLFSFAVVEVVADLVPAVKFQSAFFEALGPMGMVALQDACLFARSRGLLIIMDAKRGDIGTTAQAYAEAFLGAPDNEQPWCADALTVNPFLGRETLAPFVKTAAQNDRGIFTLVRTSNPGSHDLQDAMSGPKNVSAQIAAWVERFAETSADQSGYGHVGAVVGATHREELAGYRAEMRHAYLLLPGYGAQGARGADLADAFDERGLGAIVNSSRGITFSHREKQSSLEEWKDSVRSATEAMIADIAEHSPAGNLRS